MLCANLRDSHEPARTAGPSSTPGLKAAKADPQPAPPRADTANWKRQTAPSPVAENRGAAGGRTQRGPEPARDRGHLVRTPPQSPGPRRHQRAWPADKHHRSHGLHRSDLRTAKQPEAGFKALARRLPAPIRDGAGNDGWLQAATTAAHTCRAEAPLGDNGARSGLANDHAIPSLSAAENITTWTSGRRRRTWPRTPRTSRTTRPNAPR
jgi:hypothetical protein